MLYHQMPPNIQVNWIKRLHRAKQKQYFGENVQNYKDGSGLQFTNCNIVTGDQKIKVSIMAKF